MANDDKPISMKENDPCDNHLQIHISKKLYIV